MVAAATAKLPAAGRDTHLQELELCALRVARLGLALERRLLHGQVRRVPRLPLLRLLGRRLLLRLEHGRGRRVHGRLHDGAPLQRLDLLAQRALADGVDLARGLVLGRRLLARVAQRQARVDLHLAQLLLEHGDLRALEVALARVALLLLL